MTTRLFIGGLNYRTTEVELADFLQAVAPLAVKTNREGQEIIDRNGSPVPAVTIIRDRDFDPPRSKGYAFAEMQDEAGSKAVIEQLNGQELDGRYLRISEALPRETRPGQTPTPVSAPAPEAMVEVPAEPEVAIEEEAPALTEDAPSEEEVA